MSFATTPRPIEETALLPLRAEETAHLPPEEGKIVRMRTDRYNWAAAFQAFESGVSLEEVSEVFGIPLHTLRTKAHNENWKGLVLAARSRALRIEPEDVLQPQHQERIEQVLANRATNHRQASALRDDLELLRLNARQAMEEKSGAMTMKEIGEFALLYGRITAAVDTVQDMSSRALGDVAASKEIWDKPPEKAIHVHLPAAIAQPRQRASTPQN